LGSRETTQPANINALVASAVARRSFGNPEAEKESKFMEG
jgi:hypothetical protein